MLLRHVLNVLIRITSVVYFSGELKEKLSMSEVINAFLQFNALIHLSSGTHFCLLALHSFLNFTK